MIATDGGTAPRRWRLARLLVLLPVLIFGGIGVMLALGLGRDPQILPSVLVGKPVPSFTLPPLAGRDTHGLASMDLSGRPMLVNVFASWCVPCRIEHPLLARLSGEGIVIDGINYKDAPEAATSWLAELGDPFRHIGSDRQGRVGIEWGVYGVPETYVIDRRGKIVYRHVGPLMPRDVETRILPLLRELEQP